MNKKLLFAAMSFAALTACSTDDFESQQQVAEGVSPIQFEVINNSETTRAHMDGNTIKWDANDGDLFTLYHGGYESTTLTGYENATYTAQAGEEGKAATLTTPSMIKDGKAIMVWPVDTTFRSTGGPLTIAIPEKLDNVENNIPYVSDLIDIKTRVDAATPATYAIGADNTAGYNRKYPVYMRPMASQLILKADYAGSDAKINALATGADPINPIALTSVDLVSGPTTAFTQEIELNFTAKTATDNTRWKAVKNNAWSHVTGFGNIVTPVTQLTTTCINGLESAKFLMLPQATIAVAAPTDGVADAAIVVNTLYGKVMVADPAVTGSKYTAAEIKDAWYRYQKAGATKDPQETETKTAGTGDDAGKVRYTNNIALGLAQVINAFSANTTTKDGSLVKTEPTGAVGTRYVKVLLSHLDMNGLHIKNDKHLYDAVRVWKEIGTSDVIVNLDGDKDGNFEISQKTIAKINEINAATAKETTKRKFYVTACNVAGEPCNTIVITGGGEIAQDLTFIVNSTASAKVALNAGESWKWNSKGKVTVAASATANTTPTPTAINTGISGFINKGTFTSDATATLSIWDNASTAAQVSTIAFENALGATWDITAGDINVQFNVTNNGTVNISKGAEYHQDMAGTVVTIFTNDAQSVPERFYMNDPSKTAKQKKAFVEKIGKVNNEGVFAALAGRGQIYNYGLIEHADKDAKTYITANQTGAGFGSAFEAITTPFNKMGRINLPIENKDENNVSISATAASGFVSVTVASTANITKVLTDGALSLDQLGTYVNYCIIKKGVQTIKKVSTQIKYIEFNDDDDTEVAWDLGGTVTSKVAATYDGLMVLSPVNINLTTDITVNQSTFLGAKIYVGGKFTNKTYDGYFGKTADHAKTMYITY